MTKYLIFIVIMFFGLSCKESKTEHVQSPQVKSESLSEDVKKDVQKIKEPIELKTEKEYSLGEVKVTLTQIKSDGSIFYCKSEILVTKNNKQIGVVEFNPEPVGGDYGVGKPFQLENHLIFSKHGDYDGRTIVVSKEGKIYDFIGGLNYLDADSELLFTIYESDLNGFAVFDLKSDSILLEMSELEDNPISIHKEFNNRYFILCENGESERNPIWEIETELEQIMMVDLDQEDINSENELPKNPIEEVDCICED